MFANWLFFETDVQTDVGFGGNEGYTGLLITKGIDVYEGTGRIETSDHQKLWVHIQHGGAAQSSNMTRSHCFEFKVGKPLAAEAGTGLKTNYQQNVHQKYIFQR